MSNRMIGLLSTVVVLLMMLLVALPLFRIMLVTMSPAGSEAWRAVLVGDTSPHLFWIPLGNSLMVGMLTVVGSVLLGSFMAWLVMLTDVPARGLLGFAATISFSFPPYSIAMVWEAVFRNSRIGGYPGFLARLGMNVPDWMAWGILPISLTLVAQYFSVVFLLVSAALASIGSQFIEAATITGANRGRILRSIVFPMALPAIVSSVLLVFAGGISSFAPSAILGLPVRFFTLSVRLQSTFYTGQEERAYVLAVLLVIINAGVLFIGSRIVTGRVFATFSARGGHRLHQPLNSWRWPMFVLGAGFCAITTILPPLVLLVTSFTQSGSIEGDFTLRYWIGQPDQLSLGMAGVLRNPEVLKAAINTLWLALAVSIITLILGLLIGYVSARSKVKVVSNLVTQLSFLPYLIPSIAFGAVYIAQFGQPFGPIPSLYGTLLLLVMAGVAHTMPFAAQSGRAAMSQVAGELEDAAQIAGAGFISTTTRIIIPLTARSLLASSVLVFTTMSRELSLVLLLATPSLSTLSIVTYNYLSYNGGALPQPAYAIALIIVLISVTATLLAYKLQSVTQPWLER